MKNKISKFIRNILAIFLAFIVLVLFVKILPPVISIILKISFGSLGFHSDEAMQDAGALGKLIGIIGGVYLALKVEKKIRNKKEVKTI